MASHLEPDPVTMFMNLDDWGLDNGSNNSAALDSLASLSASTETHCLGFVLANIVGVQHYSGTINGREAVSLVREPLNPFDENAIQVRNVRGTQVGHIDRAVSEVLSPLIDSNSIKIEGLVAKSGSHTRRYKIPCQIHMFAKIEAFPTLLSMFSESGLNLIEANNPSFALSESAAVAATRSKEAVPNLDDIFKLVDENVNKKAAMEPLEPPKQVITTDLFAHQKEGLGWLVHRESSVELPPFWKFKNNKYINVLTLYETGVRPEPLRGGIFADDMGLGKTLTLLSLIALDKCDGPNGSSSGGTRISLSDAKENYPDGANKLEIFGNSRRTKNISTVRKRRRNERKGGSDEGLNTEIISSGSSSGEVLKTTLIVCPPSVISTWVTQLCEHTHRGSLKVYMYHGVQRTQDPQHLKKFDIVLTTYHTLGTEMSSVESPLKKLDWWRIILDEAHMIKNVDSQQAKAVNNLKATMRWAVTGTPIQNSSGDLFSIMVFLRFQPFSDKVYWSRLIQRPLVQNNQEGLIRLQALMATISLRRVKDKLVIGLPPKIMETLTIELSPEERQLYDLVEEEAKSVVRSYISDGSVMRNYANILTLLLRLRQICTDMALCPPDFRSLKWATHIEDVSNNPELLEKMVALLQDGEDLDCPICISPPTKAVITCCAHIFCQGCILKTLKRMKPSCPMCRHPLSESDLYAAPPPDSSEKNSSSASTTITTPLSAKGSTLLNLLTELRNRNPDAKSVVFSQFRMMLQLLVPHLNAAGFNVLVLDGTMSAKKRTSIIDEFSSSEPNSPTVLLASLKASGTGINLTAASTVFLLEPWWNPAVEEQAMDRVHRIGQKDEVRVVRMIAKGTIEERVLVLQEKKRSLAKEAFGKKGSKINVDDLRSLMLL